MTPLSPPTYLLKFNPLDDFFPFQNVIANLYEFVATSVCVYTGAPNENIAQTVF